MKRTKLAKYGALLGVMLGVLSLLSCGNAAADAEKTIGIIAAMDSEIDTLKDTITDPKIERIAGSEFYSGTIGNYHVVLVKCGMGKVSAAIGAQAMIDTYHPDYIINTGCAGALSEDLDVGDFVIAEKAVEWDLDLLALGLPRGYISALDRVEMTADTVLTEKLMETLREENVRSGMIASGDVFIDSDEKRNLILSAFPDALCAEMEGGSIAHVCEQNEVPFCIVRCISDNANRNSDVDFAEFSFLAGKKSAEYLIRFLTETKSGL